MRNQREKRCPAPHRGHRRVTPRQSMRPNDGVSSTIPFSPPVAAAPTPPPTTAAPAQTTRQVSGACGTGTADAFLQSSIHPDANGSGWETDLVATVDNNVNKAIQIDALAARLVFADGSTLSYS